MCASHYSACLKVRGMSSSVDVHGGTVWTMIWWGFKLSLKFVSNVILTRLLTPDMFGIAAIGNAVLSGITMFSDFGIHENIVRSSRSDDHYYQTAWTVQLLRGLILTVIIVLLAKPFAWFYEVGGLATFLMIVAASNLAMGLNNIESLRDYRHAILRRVAIIDIVGAIFGIGIMVLWAWFSPSYIALAVGALASTSLFTVGTYLAFPRRNCRLRFEKEAMADMLGFGKWVLISTVLAFATMQMDRLALGKLVPLHVLGLYSLAWMWASMPSQILEQWAHRVFFPLVSQYVRDETAMETIWIARRLYVLIAATAAIVIYAVSDILVASLYTLEYQGVSIFIRQLSIVFLLYTIEQSYSHVLIAYGRPRDKITGQIVSVVLFGVALLPAFYWVDVAGVITLLAVTAGVRIMWMAYQLFVSEFGKINELAELRFDIIVIIMYFPIAALLHAIVGVYNNRWYQVSAALVAGAAALLITLIAYRRLRRICETAL
jgi:O-antigen/teichoic acid export membrane protein